MAAEFTPAILIEEPVWEKIKFDGSFEVAIEVMEKLQPLIAAGKLGYAHLQAIFDGNGGVIHMIKMIKMDGTPEFPLDPGVWCVISNTDIVRCLMDNEYFAEFQPDQVQE